MGIIDAVIHSFGVYYGLDWLALVIGVLGSYLMTNRNRWGFAMSGVGCIAGFAVALMSGQFGFVAYNIILMALMARGFFMWGPSYRSVPNAAE